MILHGDVREVVRKPRHRDPPDIETGRHPGYGHARRGPLSQESKCRLDGVDERLTEPWSLFVVPGRCGVELRCGLCREPDRQAHRVSLLRNRSRSIGHGSPASSPDRARRARLSSSSAQARWRASASSTAGSSRLARSSAATVARAPAGSVSASRRIASESIDIITSVLVTTDEYPGQRGCRPVQPPSLRCWARGPERSDEAMSAGARVLVLVSARRNPVAAPLPCQVGPSVTLFDVEAVGLSRSASFPSSGQARRRRPLDC